jgi:hypothetical protein
MAARIAMIATTIISSIRVKPFCIDFMVGFLCACGNWSTGWDDPKYKPLIRTPLASGPVSQKLGWKEAAFVPDPVAAVRGKI